MSDDSTVRVTGLKELQKFLDELPAKLEQNVMAGALRAGAIVLQEQAKENLLSHGSIVHGALIESLKIGTSTRQGVVMAVVRTKLFYAKFVEYGTAAHVITGKNGGWLSFGGGFSRAVDHPGAVAKPFMRPALDTKATQATIAAAEYMKRRLQTKEGLDTAGIVIGEAPGDRK